MIFKKFVDDHTVKDVPKNGIIRIEFENEEGENVITTTAVSNIPLAFENDEKLANLNGYYRYEEQVFPEYDNTTQYVEESYIFKSNVIYKNYRIVDVSDFTPVEVSE